ncbi:MAG: hypothetical protein AAF386_13545, partial [Pseudomonadota bacterium]
VALFSQERGSYDHIIETLGHDVPLYTDDADLAQFADAHMIITVGAPEFIHGFRGRAPLALACLISPHAYVARSAQVAPGVIIAPGAFIGPYAQLGQASIINATTTVGHDVRIGENCVISPGVNIGGGCVLEDGVFIGSNVCIDPLVTIGAFSKIPSGAVVKTNIGKGMMFLPEKNQVVRMFNPKTGKSLFAR